MLVYDQVSFFNKRDPDDINITVIKKKALGGVLLSGLHGDGLDYPFRFIPVSIALKTAAKGKQQQERQEDRRDV